MRGGFSGYLVFLACLAELTRKLPDFLPVSQTMEFANIFRGLGILPKMPVLGWVQVFLYCAVREVSGINSRGEQPGQFNFKPPLFTSDDLGRTTTRLIVELVNRRLVMMAIRGIFFKRASQVLLVIWNLSFEFLRMSWWFECQLVSGILRDSLRTGAWITSSGAVKLTSSMDAPIC